MLQQPHVVLIVHCKTLHHKSHKRISQSSCYAQEHLQTTERILFMATYNYTPSQQWWNQLALTQSCLHPTYRLFNYIVTVELTTLVS